MRCYFVIANHLLRVALRANYLANHRLVCSSSCTEPRLGYLNKPVPLLPLGAMWDVNRRYFTVLSLVNIRIILLIFVYRADRGPAGCQI